MGWQKTFTLSRRSKGCHLITDEVRLNIKEGLEGVSVSYYNPDQFPISKFTSPQVGMLFLFM